MRTTLHGTIKSVTRKDLTRKSDGQPFTIFDIDTTCGRISTSNQQHAQAANGMVGQTAFFDVTAKENGFYTNYYLNAIKQEHETPVRTEWPQADISYSSPGAGTTSVTATAPQPVSFSQPGLSGAEKDASIWRQTATKVAATIGGSPSDFWANVDDLMVYYATGKVPTYGVNTRAVDGTVIAEPVGATLTSDDIPF